MSGLMPSIATSCRMTWREGGREEEEEEEVKEQGIGGGKRRSGREKRIKGRKEREGSMMGEERSV